MYICKAYKFELRPKSGQEREMRRFAGSCRFVFNKALALMKERSQGRQKRLGYAGLCKLLTDWKKEASWLLDAPSQSLQQSLKDLDLAYRNAYENHADLPRFKKKGQRDSFRYPQGIVLDQPNSRIKLPKLGWVRYRNSREVVGLVRNATVSHADGKWFVSIQTQHEVELPVPQGSAVGIDLGLTRFATLSDGSHIEPLNSFKRYQARLARYQRAMSRKVKFSSNWNKAKARLQRMHARIRNARRDFLHKASSHISQNHAMIAIEDLQVRNMSRSVAGTHHAPERSAKAKSCLNRSILDQGWYEFRRQLEYKAAWRGGLVVAVPPQYTSQTCPYCGHASANNRLTQAQFGCEDCGFEGNADWIAAINILARGHRVLACGERVQSGPSMKQEPTEATQRLHS